MTTEMEEKILNFLKGYDVFHPVEIGPIAALLFPDDLIYKTGKESQRVIETFNALCDLEAQGKVVNTNHIPGNNLKMKIGGSRWLLK